MAEIVSTTIPETIYVIKMTDTERRIIIAALSSVSPASIATSVGFPVNHEATRLLRAGLGSDRPYDQQLSGRF